MPCLPYAHLNLRHNPFGELDPEDRAALAVVEVEPLLSWLDRPGRALQLLGPHGCGKSTHLLALHRAVPGSTYVRAWRDRPLRVEPCELLLLDEADSAGWLARHRALRAASRLALSTHRDLSWALRLAGFEVRTQEVEAPAPHTLSRIFAARIEHGRRGPGPLPRVEPELVADLHRRHGRDVRAMEDELYHHFQTMQALEP